MSVMMHKLPNAATNRHPGEKSSGADGGDGSKDVAERGCDIGTLGFLPDPKDRGDEVAMPLLSVGNNRELSRRETQSTGRPIPI
jgi:hypothetical protein